MHHLVAISCTKINFFFFPNRGKTPEQIRQMFNIECDFTKEELAQVQKENEWADDKWKIPQTIRKSILYIIKWFFFNFITFYSFFSLLTLVIENKYLYFWPFYILKIAFYKNHYKNFAPKSVSILKTGVNRIPLSCG